MNDDLKAMALDIAMQLDRELGGGIVNFIRRDNKSRTVGFDEAAALAGLILGAIQIGMQYYSDKKMSLLQAYLEEHLPRSERISPAKRAIVIETVAEKIMTTPPNTKS